MGLNESSSSLIDVIFTNCINRVVCSGVLHVGISDHSLIYVIVNYLQSFLSKDIPLKLTEIFAILTEKTFHRDISRQDWSCTSDDPNVL